MRDEFEEHACGFKNEAEYDRELDEEALNFEEVENRNFEGGIKNK